MSHTIELRKVSKYYAGENSVSMGFARVDLELDMGEFVAITGESGSGKSTLLNVISGLDTYDEGEMFVCEQDTTAFRTEEYERYRKTYIGNIFQDFNLVNSYTVYQNIELVMLMCGKKASECRSRIKELIDLVGLTEYTRTKASKLSGGQKQRVAIARALAKDAPIIVADEPTGNLDSESANIVMETLSRVSKERLVVIVTHNYEQVEPYVTRKLTMHDGRIIEDKKLCEPVPAVVHPSENEAEQTGSKKRTDEMRKGSELRLGVRNTFNLPAKFILLFMVYLFLATAILGQYSSTRNSEYAKDILGYNDFFAETSPQRIVVKKADKKVFTDEEIAALEKMSNVNYVVRNDIGLDKPISLDMGADYSIDATVFPAAILDKKKLTYGRMPETDREVVIYTDSMSWDFGYIKDEGKSLIGKTCKAVAQEDYSVSVIPHKLKIVGVVIDEDAANMNTMGTSRVYMSDVESRKVSNVCMEMISRNTLDFGETTVPAEGGIVMIPSSRVHSGKVILSEDESYYFNSEKVVGKTLKVSVSNSFYKTTLPLEVETVFTDKSIESALGYGKNSYDTYSNYIFVNPADFRKLYDRGSYQVSIFMDDETAYKSTGNDLDEAGYEYLMLKDALSDITGGFGFVIKLLSYAALIIEVIVLFFIAYAVIKLIMRSRNSYYSTLRILGAGKKNTDNVLRIELLIMMLIAFAVDMVLVALIYTGVINYAPLRTQLNFLTPLDYAILLVLLLLMSLLIANRYSRKIFSKSAMNAYRGEV